MHSKSVLVVEDIEDLRLFDEETLTGVGNQVLAAATAHEALELWERSGKAIPVVLLDLSLTGGTNGQELAVRLRADSPRVQLILTTGGVPIFSEPLRWLNGVPFLQKPYSQKQLLGAVLHAQQRYFDTTAATASV
jgi:CheY-like chemotaxis protein